MSRAHKLLYWTVATAVFVCLMPVILVIDLVASPFRCWNIVFDATQEKIAEIEMRHVVILAIAKAAEDGTLELAKIRKKGLVN